MDPVTALGVAAAIVQFVNLGVKVTKKLSEYVNASPGDMPKSLRSINIQLPLLLNALSRIQDESQIKKYDTELQYILNGVAIGCLKLARELDDISNRLKPKAGENLAAKVKKAFSSLKVDQRILDIDRGLQGYIQVLVLHQVIDHTESGVALPDEPEYFEVKEKRIKDHATRENLIIHIQKAFSETVRGQRHEPTILVLQGAEGAGKTQLAIDYCHQAYDTEHFRTVFWIDGSSLAVLKLGLENAASIIRRTRAGTAEEKIESFRKFLTDRWHPWLLVVDNYCHNNFHHQSLSTLLPTDGLGAILIATRDKDAKTSVESLKVPKYLTPMEEIQRRSRVSEAIRTKTLDVIIDALDNDLSPNTVGRNYYGNDGAPILDLAAEVGFDDAVRVLLECGAELHYDPTTVGALPCGVMSGSLSTVSLLLDHEDMIFNREDRGKSSDFAFSYAIERDYADILNLLLERRATEFDADAQYTGEAFQEAAAKGYLRIFQILHSLQKFPKKLWLSTNALTQSVEKCHFEIMKFLIEEARLDPDLYDKYGQTALFHAVKISLHSPDDGLRDQFVSFLIGSGASPNIRSRSHGDTALHVAARYGQPSTIKLLLESGADVEVKDNDEETPLMKAASRKTSASYQLLTDVDIPEEDDDAYRQYFDPVMFIAIANDDRNLALIISQKHGTIDAIEPRSGNTPLLAAIKKGSTPMVRMLLRKRARQDIADKNGKLPIMWAAEAGLDLVIKALLTAKDSPGRNVVDEMGNTPLILAVRGGHTSSVTTLLALDADRDVTNKFGETALDIAEDKELHNLVEILNAPSSIPLRT